MVALVAPSLVVAAWAIGAELSVIRAEAAAIRDFPLFAVLVHVADEHPAVYAGVRALEAGVVRLYGIVVISGRWVRWCARLSGVHSDLQVLWAGARERGNARRAQ